MGSDCLYLLIITMILICCILEDIWIDTVVLTKANTIKSMTLYSFTYQLTGVSKAMIPHTRGHSFPFCIPPLLEISKAASTATNPPILCPHKMTLTLPAPFPRPDVACFSASSSGLLSNSTQVVVSQSTKLSTAFDKEPLVSYVGYIRAFTSRFVRVWATTCDNLLGKSPNVVVSLPLNLEDGINNCTNEYLIKRDLEPLYTHP